MKKKMELLKKKQEEDKKQMPLKILLFKMNMDMSVMDDEQRQ